MADNVAITPGAGANIATDDIGGTHYQRVKIVIGGDGSATDIAGDASNGVDVDVTRLPSGSVAALTAVTGNGTATGALRVSLASDSTGQVGLTGVSNGNGAASGGLRVTLANDSTGQVAIASGSTVGISGVASVSVFGGVTVSNTGTFAVQVDGAALTALQLIDNVVVAEDAAHASGDSGVMALAVRRDANSSLVGTDGDYAPLQVDANGSLKVNVISGGGGGGGASATDDAAFTVGSGSGTPMMGLADETSPDSVDEGDVGVVRMTLARGLHVNLRDSTGGITGITSNPLAVIGQYRDVNDVFTPETSRFLLIGGFRGDSASALSDGDPGAARLTPVRALHVNLRDNIGNEVFVGGGYSISRVLSAASTNATSAKASAGRVHGWYLYNANVLVRYFKLYNKASAPTVGTDTPVMTIPIPPGAEANVEFVRGITFSTGIAYALTTGVADNDNTGVAANELIVNLLYI